MRSDPSALEWKLWLVVLVELICPVPAVLTIGAIVVLATKPPWFRRLVDDLYGAQ